MGSSDYLSASETEGQEENIIEPLEWMSTKREVEKSAIQIVYRLRNISDVVVVIYLGVVYIEHLNFDLAA